MNYGRDYQRPFWRGFVHAFAVIVYSTILSIVLLSLQRLFAGEIGVVIQLTFDIFLVIFSFAVCGYLIFFEPLKLAMHHHFKASATMLGSTLGWLLIFLVIFLVGLVQSLSA